MSAVELKPTEALIVVLFNSSVKYASVLINVHYTECVDIVITTDTIINSFSCPVCLCPLILYTSIKMK